MGWETVLFCEKDDFCSSVLKYYWSKAYHHRDIHSLTEKIINEELTKRKGIHWNKNEIIVSGGFP